MIDLVIMKYHAWVFILLFTLGLFVTMTSRNLLKKLVGLYLVQTAIILFFVALGAKWGATVPILMDVDLIQQAAINPDVYMNPLPHTLMLTAIVVGVSTLGVSVALTIMIYMRYNSLEEDKILEAMQ